MAPQDACVSGPGTAVQGGLLVGEPQRVVLLQVTVEDVAKVLAVAVVLVALVLLAWASRYTRKQRVFKNEVCCVVGASKGIGKNTAMKLAARGAKAFILVDMVDCEETAQSCKSHGCDAVYQFKCDVAQRSQVEKLFADISKQEIGFVSLVVNCAGIVSGKAFLDLDVGTFERVVNVNLLANFAIVKGFLPAMLERNEGCLVSISSLMGLMGGSRLTDYCASKFGIVGMFEALRLEFGSSHPGVGFVTVCPYAVNTGMFDGIFEGTMLTRIIRYIFPLLKVEDVAESVILAAERDTSVAVLPFIFGPLINIVRCLPSPLYEFVLTLMGGRDGMRSFRGKSELWPDAPK